MKPPVWQTVLAAVQEELVQQLSVAPPQVPQAPFEQVPASGLGQLLPLAVQNPPTQQPPLAQALSAQQTWPAPPHVGAASAVSGKAALSLLSTEASTTPGVVSVGESPRASGAPSSTMGTSLVLSPSNVPLSA